MRGRGRRSGPFSRSGGESIAKIKEKKSVKKKPKQRRQSAPKELLRRGLSDGTERLRGQFREASQRGEASQYGGDQIENTAVRGMRFAERRAEKLLKRKNRQKEQQPNKKQLDEAQPDTSVFDQRDGAYRGSPESIENKSPDTNIEYRDPSPRIKTKETVCEDRSPRSTPGKNDVRNPSKPSPHNSAEPSRGKPSETTSTPDPSPDQPVIKTRDVYVRQQSPPQPHSTDPVSVVSPPGETAPPPKSPKSLPEAPAVKTKEAYIRQQAPAASQPPSETVRQGKQEFIQAQGRKAAVKRSEDRRRNIDTTSQHHAPQKDADMPYLPTSKRQQYNNSHTFRDHRPAKQAEHQVRNITGHTSRDTVVGNRSAAKASKKAVKGTGRSAKQAAKTTSRSAKQTVKTAEQTAKVTQKTAQAAAKASQRAVQAVHATAKAAATTVKATAKATAAAVKAAIAAAQELITAIAAGGWVVIVIVLVICLVAMLIASPFGLFFSGEDSGTGLTMPEAVVQLNGEFTSQIEQIQADNPHDTLDLDNAGSAAMISNWNDVLAVYAVRVAADETSPESVAVVTDTNLAILREIFWEMNQISYLTESKEHTETVTNDDGEEEEVTTTENILHITVTTKDCWQMADEYGFNADQREMLTELLKPEYQELFLALTGSYQNITLSPQEIQQIMENLPDDLSEGRRQVVLTAYQLLGRVNYFWGGKSLVLGWDSRWGTPMEVWAAGSTSTGTVRPYGLDCSGFVDWVFYNVSGGSYVIGHGGGASAQHSYCANISWSDAIPGDLVFYPGDSHVGIVCGFDTNGNVQIIHCASGANNVVVTGKSGFATVGSPNYYSE